MKKRKKLKKEVYYFLAIIIFIVLASIFGVNKYKEYKYHQTYEYKLLEHGYDNTSTKKILKTFNNNDDLDYFLKNEVNEKYIAIIKEKYFLKKNFYQYIDYLNKNKKMDTSKIVRNINIHLDKKFYELNLNADITKDTSMLVNKYYLLTKDYVPDDLVNVSQTYSWGSNQRVRKVAYDAFLDMWEQAKTDGFYLMISSSYRSYEEQEIVYNNYKKQGTKYADSLAARPGASEHQTGLTLDIFSKTNSNRQTFKDSEEAKWLLDNSYKFGFILRYPENQVNVTGYNYEAWHFRYVGKNIATYIHDNNISFDEYYAYYIEK
ncbi:D-alanyl-D-alanine carboxypeptidase family protein [bacterium]|nr:D-alanyl-D-alanine carboxypeptidase family protein [bacterium]